MYSRNSCGILSTALRNSSMAFPPLLSSAAITLIRSHLFIIFNRTDGFDEVCDSYLYFWINFSRAVATRSWEADKRVNMGYMLMSESSVEWDSNDIWGTENSFAVNWTSSFKSLWVRSFFHFISPSILLVISSNNDSNGTCFIWFEMTGDKFTRVFNSLKSKFNIIISVLHTYPLWYLEYPNEAFCLSLDQRSRSHTQ